MSGIGRRMGGGVPNVPNSILPPNPRIWFLGDSNTYGADVNYDGMLGGYPTYVVQNLRRTRSDFEVVASQFIEATNAPAGSVVWNEGHSGYSQELITADLAGYVATMAAQTPNTTPDLVVIMLGTNTAGDNLAQMQAARAALYVQIRTSLPNSVILDLGYPNIVDGTSTHATLAAQQLLHSQFMAWLPGFVATQANAFYSSAAQVPNNGDFQEDGVHWSQGGYAVAGEGIAAAIDALMGAPASREPVMPRAFRKRTPWQSVKLTTNNTDYGTITGHSGFIPSATKPFTLALEFNPDDLTNYGPGGAQGILQYGDATVPLNEYALYRIGSQLNVSFLNQTLFSPGGAGMLPGIVGFIVNKWYRIVLSVDPVNLLAALYVNGELWGFQTVSAYAAPTQQAIGIGGTLNNWTAALGYYSKLQVFQSTPGGGLLGGVTCLKAVEADYFDGASLAPGAGVASYTLNGVVTDDVYDPGEPNPSMVLHGGAASEAAWPVGPARPWEVQAFGPAWQGA
jgi:lysophospholipase L1-like esterase